MKLSNLSKTTRHTKKRIGRGHGSGRGGHTSTRGTKGQKSRGKVGLFFEGTKIKKSLLKRLPLFRGKGKFKPLRPTSLIVNLKYLNVFKAQEQVTIGSLIEKGILAKDLPETAEVKILGDGEISIPLTVLLPTSKNAKEKIEKAGGKVEAGLPGQEGKNPKAEIKRIVSRKTVVKSVKKAEVKSSSAKATEDK